MMLLKAQDLPDRMIPKTTKESPYTRRKQSGVGISPQSGGITAIGTRTDPPPTAFIFKERNVPGPQDLRDIGITIMKHTVRIIAALLAALLCTLCLFGCIGKKDGTQNDDSKENNVSNTENPDSKENGTAGSEGGEFTPPVPTEPYLLVSTEKNGTVYSYVYNDEGQKISGTFASDGEIMYTMQFTYQANGDGTITCSQTNTATDGSPTPLAYDVITDSEGRVLRDITYDVYRSGPEYKEEMQYEYDSEGKLYTETYLKADGKGGTYQNYTITYTYDEADRPIRADYTADDGTLTRYTLYRYNEAGEEVFRQDRRADGTLYIDGSTPSEETLYEWKYEYDDLGRVTRAEKIEISSPNRTIEGFQYRYDEMGGCIYERLYGTSVYETVNTYAPFSSVVSDS